MDKANLQIAFGDFKKGIEELRSNWGHGLSALGNFFKGQSPEDVQDDMGDMLQVKRVPTKVAEMDRYQNAIPKLPLPALEETLEEFLKTIKTFVSDEEYEETKTLVEEFKQSGVGEQAHKNLTEYDQTQLNSSYIEEFWNDAYLAQQSSIAINTNPTVVLTNGQDSGSSDLCGRAAGVTFAILKFAEACKSRKLEPDMIKKTPLDMWQYDKLFGGARIPCASEDGMDVVRVDTESTHIVVIHRSQFFKFDVCDDEGALLVDESQLATNFNNIVAFSRQADQETITKTAIAVLTAGKRADWAKNRAKLMELDERNVQGIQAIDSALFVVVLDDVALQSDKENFANMLHGTLPSEDHHGTYCQRWYDKLNLIVTETGYTAVTWEHSLIDGHTILRFVSDVVSDNAIKFVQSVNGGGRVESFMKTIARKGTSRRKILSSGEKDVFISQIAFMLDVDMEKRIQEAHDELKPRIEELQSQVLNFSVFGSKFIKQCKMSPDAFVQMSFLYAFYAVQGFLPNQYEAIMTKHFRHGRTAAGRSATPEAKAFVEAMIKESEDEVALLDMLREATVAHSKMTKRCATGHGVDRPLYGMQAHWEKYTKGTDEEFDNGMSAFFNSPGWQKLNVTLSSTSFCGNPSLKLFGFGPVAEEGVGVGYILGKDYIVVCVTSKFVDTLAYKAALEEYYGKIQKILNSDIQRKLSAVKT